ncbi:Mov34/MPN/PAD-1 family protein [Rubrobacter taiwanensis]|jgi:proteasome lid subunit RPN8/RPN11|nr:M67 family metallopeptidase [Rubrobacter taiwanensis]
MIELPERLLEEMVTHARREAPREVCGWLAGAEGRVREIHPVPNVADAPELRFLMEPGAQLAAMREIERRGLEIVGTYHSHPRTPADPSARDRSLALYPDLAHLILSLAGEEPELRAHRISDGRLKPLGLKVQ